MSRDNRAAVPEEFERKLDQLRTRIDLLPEAQRPLLQELADTLKQQNQRIEKYERKSDANC